ncbi:MAG: toxin-antitoxin system YwqK family antitoxin [Mangrovibacterium sp.]
MNTHIIACIFILFSSFTTLSQPYNSTDSKGLKQGYWEKSTPDGKPIYKGEFKNDKPVGNWKRYHQNGTLRAQLNYYENTDSCQVVLFNNSGKKIAEGIYINEKREGKWTFFRNMIKISEEYYVSGEKTGLSRSFYDTGELMSESNYQKGIPNGTYRTYLKNGTIYFECLMKEGMRNGYCQSFFQNGTVESVGYYENDLRERDWQYYHEDGSKAYELHYKGGMVTNTAVRDSVDNARMKNMEKNNKQHTDPEKFMDDPSGYMQLMTTNP